MNLIKSITQDNTLVTASQMLSMRPPVRTKVELRDYNYANFFYDGSKWRPVNGCCSLYNLAGSNTTPVSTIVNAGASVLFALPTTGGNCKIPAGLVIPGQSIIRVSAYFKKTGASAATSCTTCLGTSNSLSDSQITNQSLASDTGAFNMLSDISIESNTRCMVAALTTANGASGTVGAQEYTTNINFAADMYLNFGTISNTAGDGLKLIRLNVSLFQ